MYFINGCNRISCRIERLRKLTNSLTFNREGKKKKTTEGLEKLRNKK